MIYFYYKEGSKVAIGDLVGEGGILIITLAPCYEQNRKVSVYDYMYAGIILTGKYKKLKNRLKKYLKRFYQIIPKRNKSLWHFDIVIKDPYKEIPLNWLKDLIERFINRTKGGKK